MRILITGDLFIDDNVYQIKTCNASLEQIRSLTNSCDFSIANLEAPLTISKNKILKTGPHLKANPDHAHLLIELGFNTCTLANNHILDFGADGVEETIESLNKLNLSHVGANQNGKEKSPLILKKQNEEDVIIINFCENEWSTDKNQPYLANGFNELESYYQIKKAKDLSNNVIVIYHGGNEHYALPSPRIKKLFRFFIDVGASAVICHHSHVASGWEVYKGAPIFFSLGNFLFNNSKQSIHTWHEGLAVVLSFKAALSFECIHFKQMQGTSFFDLVDISEIKEKFSVINQRIQDDEFINLEFNKFVKVNTKMYNSYLLPYSNKYLAGLINHGMLPSPWTKKKKRYLKTMFYCESHRDVVQQILTNENSNSQE
jgi:poly-gamma-glutamate capsule biosynthesis protein CapA/YwtB (metallophosphatase superfamily)